jgi:putative heme-binding domain-containing protein
MLRLMRVAIHRGQVPVGELTAARKWLVEEFPSGDENMNQELANLLVFMQSDEIIDRYTQYLRSKAPAPQRLHAALQLRYLESGWKSAQKWELIESLERFARSDEDSNLPIYARNSARDFARGLTEEESVYVLERAVKWPNAALGSLFRLPEKLSDDQLARLEEIDRQLSERAEESSKPLQVGIVALLARSGDTSANTYLREIWRRDPDRRQATAMGLAQKPDGDNWNYLVRSLAFLEGPAAIEVLEKLRTVDQAPEDPEFYRQVILRGLLLKDQGADRAIALLEHWSQENPASAGDGWEASLKAWQKWYGEQYPDRPEAVLPVADADSKWKLGELLEYLTTGEGAKVGSATRGASVFAKAQCSKCHNFAGRGERLGPELTTVNKRFTRKEILESLLFPSHVVSDQYASKTVITDKGRKYTGMLTPGADGEKIVLQSNGEKITLRESQIEEIVPSKVSSMPAGLLNDLKQEEIADLFAYLMNPPRSELVNRPSGSSRTK